MVLLPRLRGGPSPAPAPAAPATAAAAAATPGQLPGLALDDPAAAGVGGAPPIGGGPKAEEEALAAIFNAAKVERMVFTSYDMTSKTSILMITRIQAMFRAGRARRETASQKQRRLAASMQIQAIQRRRLAQKEAQKKRSKREAKAAREKAEAAVYGAAATKLQSAHRGRRSRRAMDPSSKRRLARRRLHAKEAAARQAESLCVAYGIVGDDPAAHRRVTRLQAMARGRKGRRRAAERRLLLDPVVCTIVRLQARWRARMTRRARASGGVAAARARDSRIRVSEAIDSVFNQFDRDGSGVRAQKTHTQKRPR
jgi:hypothetical protein